MFDWIKKLAIMKYVASAIRKLLAMLGMYLLTKIDIDAGIINAFIESTTNFLIALAPIVVSFLWSWVTKAKKVKADE